jgi:predicted dehydrogenase
MARLAVIGTMDEIARCVQVVPRIVGAQIAAAVDRFSCAAQSLIQDIEIIADDFDALLTNHAAAFDAVVVHGEVRDHLKHCHRAAEAGKHLLLEQLIGLPASDAAAIDASCAAAGVRLMSGQSLRFLPEIQAIRKSLAAGQLGVPGLLRMHFWEPVTLDNFRQRSPSASCLTADSLRSWIVAATDLAISLFQEVPTHVYSSARFPAVSAQGEHEYRQVHLGFGGGGMALVDHASTLPPGENYFSMSLIGSKGAAYVDDHHNMQLLYRGGQPMALRGDPNDLQLLGMLQEFVAAIQENREPMSSGADAIRAIRVSESIAESSATRQVIRCDRRGESKHRLKDRETTSI